MEKQSVSFVIPTYCESATIRKTIESLQQVIHDVTDDYEIIVVDDDSPDNTSSIIAGLARMDSRIKLIHRMSDFGLAASVKSGFMSSIMDTVVVMDADGQHETNSIVNGLKLFWGSDADVLIGSRFIRNKQKIGLTKERLYGSKIANRLSRLTLPSRYSMITDYMSGLAIMNRTKCEYYMRKIDIAGFKFVYELLRISKGGLKVGEFSILFGEREGGVSKLSSSIVWDWLISIIYSSLHGLLPRRVIEFGTMNLAGLGTHVIMASLIMPYVGFIQAQVVSGIMGGTVNYAMNNKVTFKRFSLRGGGWIYGLFRYQAVSLFSLVSIVMITERIFNEHHLYSLLVTTMIAFTDFIWKYAASSRFVWSLKS